MVNISFWIIWFFFLLQLSNLGWFIGPRTSNCMGAPTNDGLRHLMWWWSSLLICRHKSTRCCCLPSCPLCCQRSDKDSGAAALVHWWESLSDWGHDLHGRYRNEAHLASPRQHMGQPRISPRCHWANKCLRAQQVFFRVLGCTTARPWF